MPESLHTTERGLRFYRDGFISAVSVLSVAEAAHWRHEIRRLTDTCPAPLATDHLFAGYPHLVFPVIAAWIQDRRIVNVVADIIGPDIVATEVYVSNLNWVFDHLNRKASPGCGEPAPDNRQRIVVQLALTVVNNDIVSIPIEPTDSSQVVAPQLRPGQISLYGTAADKPGNQLGGLEPLICLHIYYVAAKADSAGRQLEPGLAMRGNVQGQRFQLLSAPRNALAPGALLALRNVLEVAKSTSH